ncbi:MARCKS-related protein [Phascolarctos cinereus]|uniref:MARCKS-related protein n=1 Tax=Phascolarctos cinereus TaxID=38626 RepID=A0A6P5K256_PHACI|nr:MARCKS-related protein [Phascolarctos cinereus]
MGSQSSKAPRGDVSADEAAPAKANGQENGHVKSNGDVPPKAEAEAAPPGPAEPADAARAGGDAIEATSPAAQSPGGEAKAEGPPKETPKKKKKFSFKKPFKLSGLSFKRNRKEAGGDSAGSSPTEEGAPEAEATGGQGPLQGGEEEAAADGTAAPAQGAQADDRKLEEPASEGAVAPEQNPTPAPEGEQKE